MAGSYKPHTCIDVGVENFMLVHNFLLCNQSWGSSSSCKGNVRRDGVRIPRRNNSRIANFVEFVLFTCILTSSVVATQRHSSNILNIQVKLTVTRFTVNFTSAITVILCIGVFDVKLIQEGGSSWRGRYLNLKIGVPSSRAKTPMLRGAYSEDTQPIVFDFYDGCVLFYWYDRDGWGNVK